jgi:hypothetical protein
MLAFPHTGSAAIQKTTLPVTIENDFVVEPVKTEILLAPGESITKNITITSRMGKPTTFRITTEDLVGSNDPEHTVVLLGDDTSPYSLKNLIKAETKEFTLTTGERITIPVTIAIPQNAEPRGYYGALIVANEPEKLEGAAAKEAEGKTRLVSRIGSLFLLRVKGPVKEIGALESFNLKAPIKHIYEHYPNGFEVAFKNSGNVHLVPHGKITVKNLFGKTVGEIPVDAYFALPDSIRYREVAWNNNAFAFGLYSASLSLYKGYDAPFDTAKIHFWVLPWKVLSVVIVAILAIAFGGHFVLTRFELKKK